MKEDEIIAEVKAIRKRVEALETGSAPGDIEALKEKVKELEATLEKLRDKGEGAIDWDE